MGDARCHQKNASTSYDLNHSYSRKAAANVVKLEQKNTNNKTRNETKYK